MTFMLSSLLELAGLGAVAFGVWLIFPPAGFIVGGLCLLLIAWRLPWA